VNRCAHQVCNYADCIKVASDFISFENVGRCWKGTSLTLLSLFFLVLIVSSFSVSDEFRAQTRHKDLWRSDVLQLKSALLWAWVRLLPLSTPVHADRPLREQYSAERFEWTEYDPKDRTASLGMEQLPEFLRHFDQQQQHQQVLPPPAMTNGGGGGGGGEEDVDAEGEMDVDAGALPA
jgi:hypothetical protein